MVAPLMVSMFTIFTYVLAKHDGMAPCVQGGLLSLALCKPKVRKGIENKNGVGDALVGLRQGSRRAGKHKRSTTSRSSRKSSRWRSTTRRTPSSAVATIAFTFAATAR